MKNLSDAFIAEDTLRYYDEMAQKIIDYAKTLGIDTIYLSFVMENPDGTMEKSRKVLVNQVEALTDQGRADTIVAVRNHVNALIIGR